MQDLLNPIKKYLKYFLIGLGLLLVTISYIYGKGGDVEENLIEEEINLPKEIIEEKEDLEELVETEEFITFDIKGAVVKPGAYKLKKGQRISDAINISGGLTNKADTSLINLSKKLIDEMVIIIHTKDEVLDCLKEEPLIIYKEIPCVCPEIKNDGLITEEPKPNDIKESETQEPSSNDVTETNNKISINTATLVELMELPGIGEAKGKSIITYREENKGFNSIEELLNVKGIGDAVFDKLKDLITI